ncbi:hypothetical protein ACFE04_027963 [Oxalis oulophora]
MAEANLYLATIMTTTRTTFSFLVSFLLLIVNSSNAHILKTCRFDAIYQFGDSLSDTGNVIRQNPNSCYGRLPYGQDFLEKSTGRCSNGLLMIDYLAISSGLPLLDAYLSPDGTFSHGVNFAVAGATALPVEELAAKHIFNPMTNTSLTTQLEWFANHLNASTCYDDQRECSKKLKSALFMVGEIGGNDYNYPLFQGKSVKEVKALVPQVVQTIKNAVSKVISYGAVRVIVPGNFPIGCLPIFLTQFQTNDSAAYDKLHCLKDLNRLASYHNKLLRQTIQELRRENPSVIIEYGDYFNALKWVLKHTKLLGFDTTVVQKACCGIGGDYNCNVKKTCGSRDVTVCLKPDTHISWDGVHPTQQAYRYITQWLIHDIFPKLHCLKATI